jgi:hypothetical protein
LHDKTWLVATGRATFDEAFVTKPPPVRQILQDEITQLRDDWSESIWLNVFTSWMISLQKIVGVDVTHIAVTDLRFLIELRGLKALGGRILHIEAADQQANVAPGLRGHRSEVELNSPEVNERRDASIVHRTEGIGTLKRQGWDVLPRWEWRCLSARMSWLCVLMFKHVVYRSTCPSCGNATTASYVSQPTPWVARGTSPTRRSAPSRTAPSTRSRLASTWSPTARPSRRCAWPSPSGNPRLAECAPAETLS